MVGQHYLHNRHLRVNDRVDGRVREPGSLRALSFLILLSLSLLPLSALVVPGVGLYVDFPSYFSRLPLLDPGVELVVVVTHEDHGAGAGVVFSRALFLAIIDDGDGVPGLLIRLQPVLQLLLGPGNSRRLVCRAGPDAVPPVEGDVAALYHGGLDVPVGGAECLHTHSQDQVLSLLYRDHH